MPDNTAQIAEIDEVLNSGMSKHASDGQVIEFNEAQLRRQRDYLIRTDTSGTYTGQARSKALKVNLK